MNEKKTLVIINNFKKNKKINTQSQNESFKLIITLEVDKKQELIIFNYFLSIFFFALQLLSTK